VSNRIDCAYSFQITPTAAPTFTDVFPNRHGIAGDLWRDAHVDENRWDEFYGLFRAQRPMKTG
jgi:hypothetical protein